MHYLFVSRCSKCNEDQKKYQFFILALEIDIHIYNKKND